jgi:hypothetical protein
MEQLERICNYLWDMAMKEDNDESWYCDAFKFLSDFERRVHNEAREETK